DRSAADRGLGDVVHVAFEQLGARGDVGAVAGGEVVDDADPAAPGQQGLRQVGADEAPAAGDHVEFSGHQVRPNRLRAFREVASLTTSRATPWTFAISAAA